MSNNGDAVAINGEPDEEQLPRVTAHTYGAIDTTHATDECWLLRVPQKLYECWQHTPEGTNLGELIFTKGGTINGQTIKPSLQVHVADEVIDAFGQAQQQQQQVRAAQQHTKKAASATTASSSSSIPRIPDLYSLEAMTKKIPTYHPFVRQPGTGRVNLLGTVTRTANLQVAQGDENYRQLLQNRLLQTAIHNSRYVKPIAEATSVATAKSTGNSNIATSSRNPAGFGNAVFNFGQRNLEAQERLQAGQYDGDDNDNDDDQSRKKRARQFAPDQAVRTVLFELFQRQRYWTIKDLRVAALHGGLQPESAKKLENEMRDLLRDTMGTYHRAGDYKNMWELKSEFQQQQQQQPPATATAMTTSTSDDSAAAPRKPPA